MEAAIKAALTTVAGDATDAITSVAPIGITVMGAFLVWRLGIKFFKSIAK